MSKTLRFSLLRDCWEGRLFALDTWDFWGFGFWVFGTGGLVHGMHLVCVFTSEHCAELRIFGARMVSGFFWESASWHILGNGDGCSWEAWILDWGLFQIFSFEKSIAIACLSDHLFSSDRNDFHVTCPVSRLSLVGVAVAGAPARPDVRFD